MSIEYTLDIQLTELGFSDHQQPVEGTSEEPSDDSTASLSAGPKKKRSIGQKAGGTRKSARSKPGRKKLKRTKSKSDGVESDAEIISPKKKDLSSETLTLHDVEDGQKSIEEHGQEKSTENQKEEESDDTENSEVYEEEEVDEEDELEDEELNNEPNNYGDYRCSVCDLQLPSKFKLQDHMNLHTGARPYCCAECGKRFCQINNYRIHLRTHAEVKLDWHCCRICRASFRSLQGLNQHFSKTHFEDEFYECDLCKRVFTSLKDCEDHVKSHKSTNKFTCDICGRNFLSDKSLSRHRQRTCPHNLKCTDCPKTFAKKNALLKHSFSHLGLLPYTCIRCRCHFRLAKLYRQHKCEPQRIHCEACLREFLSREDFQQHKKDTGCWGNQDQNQKADEIRCLECGLRFETSDELKNHAGAHQRVLKCAECGKGFRSALLLMSHMGGHAGQSPCFCKTCGLGFPHQQNYDGHLKTCGQMAPSTSASKKKRSLQGPLPKDSGKRASLTDPPNPVSVPEVATSNPAKQVEESNGSGSESGAAGSKPPSGLWSLTLDKKPPPGVKLLFLLPVCQPGGVSFPVTTSQTLPMTATQTQESGSEQEVNGALGLPLNPAMQLLTEVKRETVTPLDLSNKYNSAESDMPDAPHLSIKSEPEEFNVSGADIGADNVGDDKTESRVMNMCNDVKTFKTDPTESFPLTAVMSSQRQIVNIKEEPQSPSISDFQMSDCRPETEIKKEVDFLGSACGVVDK